MSKTNMSLCLKNICLYVQTKYVFMPKTKHVFMSNKPIYMQIYR